MNIPLRHRLLLVGQAITNYSTLRNSLERLGVDVLLVIQRQAGLLSFREDDIDMVMIDIDAVGGIELLSEMADDPRELPLIAVSHRKNATDVVSALRHGATDYLMLPVKNINVLAHAMERAMERAILKRENLAYRTKLESANRELLESLTHLQQDQQAGKHVQQLLLPETPKKIDGYQFCHFIKPSLYLSGDFVDYFLVGENHAIFFVADVSGHGASSAFVTVFLKNLFARKRSDFLHRGSTAILSPAKMLAIANRELIEMGIGKHVTMCVGAVDLKCQQMSYAVAGHLPAPVLAVNGQTAFLPEHDMPVGLFTDAEFSDHMISFPEGAVLSLFSDGILEVLQQDNLEQKEQALLDLLKSGQRSSIELAEAFDLAGKNEPPDDIAILVVSRL